MAYRRYSGRLDGSFVSYGYISDFVNFTIQNKIITCADCIVLPWSFNSSIILLNYVC